MKYMTKAELEDIKCPMEKRKTETQIFQKDIKMVDPITDLEKSNWKTRQVFNGESITPEMEEEFNARCYKSKKTEKVMEFTE